MSRLFYQHTQNRLNANAIIAANDIVLNTINNLYMG